MTKRQKQILDFITKYTKKNKYSPTIEEIRKHFRLKSISNIHQHLEALKKAGHLDREKNKSRGTSTTKISSAIKIPILGTIAAGQPIEALEIQEGHVSVSKEELKGSEKKYALRVQGDSMIDEGIFDGDIVVIREQKTADDGETVVAIIDDNKATLKKLYREKDKIRLEPRNPKMKPLFRTDVEIRGVVVKIIRNLEPGKDNNLSPIIESKKTFLKRNVHSNKAYHATKKIPIYKKYKKGTRNYILNLDTNTALDSFDDNSIDLMITSPSYYLGKDYEKKESFNNYLDYHQKTIKKLHKKLKINGSIYWNVAQTPINGEIIPLGAIFYQIFKDAGFYMKNWIIWHFEGGVNTKSRFSGRYENILWFVKDPNNYKFNLDDVRVPAKWQSDKRVNPKGKNPTDVWEFSTKDLKPEEVKFFIESIVSDKNRVDTSEVDNFMYLDRVVNVSKEKTTHPCQFPEKLIERIIKVSSDKNDTVVDIFLGSGTTGKVAVDLNRKFIGIDLDKTYCNIAKKRIEKYAEK
jgi:adenine-specific DNA-methyltransferase